MIVTEQEAREQVCRSCSTAKPWSEFHRNPHTATGYSRQCRTCRAEYRKAANRRESTRALSAAHSRESYRRATATPDGRARVNANTRRWKRRNPEKIAAHDAVMRALRSGRMKRGPCEVCGARKVHAHHDDYSKPLVVRWLCHAHHAATHRGLAYSVRLP